jgi:Skp family chaperone for outer membrane proteins
MVICRFKQELKRAQEEAARKQQAEAEAARKWQQQLEEEKRRREAEAAAAAAAKAAEEVRECTALRGLCALLPLQLNMCFHGCPRVWCLLRGCPHATSC